MSGWDTVATVAASVLGTAGVGLGGLVTWRNRRLPAAAHDLAERAERDDHWDTLMRNHLATVVEPLNKRMEDMGADQEKLKIEVRELREQLESQRTKFWGLINHTRQLKLWIVRHVHPDIWRAHPLPTTTEELTADIAVDIT